MKKHEALMSDLEAYHSVIDDLRETAQACKVRTRRTGGLARLLFSKLFNSCFL